MSIVFLVLRVLHVVAGAFWVGATLLFYGFLFPAIRATKGGAVMSHLANKSKLPIWMTISGLTTVIAGIGLYDTASGHFQNMDWIRSRSGIAFTAGGIIAILAMLEGIAVIRPTAMKLGALGGQIAAAGGPPSPEQAQQMAAMQDKMGRTGSRGAAMLVVTIVLMAIARYL